MGSQAHAAIQNYLKRKDLKTGVIGNAQLYLMNPSGERKGFYYVDYARTTSEGTKEFYEIKPVSYMKNKRGDKQLEKYISRDGEAVKGMELLYEIQNSSEPVQIYTMMKTALGNESMTITLKVDPENHPGMIFYELDDGRTPSQEFLEVAEKVITVVVVVALCVATEGAASPVLAPAL